MKTLWLLENKEFKLLTHKVYLELNKLREEVELLGIVCLPYTPVLGDIMISSFTSNYLVYL